MLRSVRNTQAIKLKKLKPFMSVRNTQVVTVKRFRVLCTLNLLKLEIKRA